MTYKLNLSLLAVLLSFSFISSRDQWTSEQANTWYSNVGWFAGCNYIPRTAENTLEMWQAETFDPKIIDQELRWASKIGFKVIRVFTHHLVWKQNPKEFKDRIDQFLFIAYSHGIKTMFVLFDDCWNPEGYLGTQPPPIPGVHNSRWVQAPGEAEYSNQDLFPLFEQYVTDVISSFNQDKRIFMWDIYNEPGNSNHILKTMPLLTNVFKWARDANPVQPISSGPWNWGNDFKQLNDLQIAQSDVITFHTYDTVEKSRVIVEQFKSYGRPAICTEYMARTIGSKFQTHIPMFYQEDVPAINWGLVNGKTQTIYPWNSPEGSPPPKIWFHEIFDKDGTVFDEEEINVIRKYCLRNNSQ